MLSTLKPIVDKYKTIIKNTGYLSIIEFFHLLLPFVAMSYIIKTVGAENYGLAVFSQAVIYYFTIFVNWGLDISAVKDVSVYRNDNSKLCSIVSSVLLVKLGLFVVAMLVFSVLLFVLPFMAVNKLLFVFAFMNCASEILFPVWFFQGVEKMKFMTLCKAGSIFFYAVTVFIFVRQPDDYIYVVLLQSTGNILAGVLCLLLMVRKFNLHFVLPTRLELKKTFVDGGAFFMSRLSIIVNNTTAKTVSGIFFSMEFVSAFDVAQKIAMAAVVPMQMLNQAVYPHIAKTLDISFVRNFAKINLGISLFFSAVFFVMAPWLVSLFAGNTLPLAVDLLRILCLWVFFAGITTYLGTPVLVSFGHSKEFNISVVYSTLVLLLIYGLCYVAGWFTIYNFAVALAASELTILLYRLRYCFKYKIFEL